MDGLVSVEFRILDRGDGVVELLDRDPTKSVSDRFVALDSEGHAILRQKTSRKQIAVRKQAPTPFRSSRLLQNAIVALCSLAKFGTSSSRLAKGRFRRPFVVASCDERRLAAFGQQSARPSSFAVHYG
jgi:hypothetical protein